jgi:hypothetical protein
MGELNTQKFIAILFFLIVGFLIVWNTLSTGGDILKNTKKSKIYDSEKMAKDELQRKQP